MSGHHYDDWETREEAATRIARANADDLQHHQQQKERLKRFLAEQIEILDVDDLELLYHIAYGVKDYKVFFKVLKNLK